MKEVSQLIDLSYPSRLYIESAVCATHENDFVHRKFLQLQSSLAPADVVPNVVLQDALALQVIGITTHRQACKPHMGK